MAELYRFELKKCLQQKVLWITGGILLLCLCLWGAAACLQTTDSGLRGEEIIRLHREGGAALAGETVDQDMLDQFRPAYEKMVFAGDARELMGCIDIYEFLGHVLDTAASAEILATLLGVTGLVYGLEGFGVSALFTLLMPLGASIGQVTLILFGAFLAAAAVTSLAAMVLSQVTRNSVATMGILVGILLLTTLITAVPESPRLLSVLWYLLPSNFVSLQGAFRYDLLSVGGLSLTTWQVTPVVYLLLTALLALGGRRLYRRCQVGAR